MNLKNLIAARPKAEATAAELAAALARAEAALSDATARADALIGARGTTLLDGTSAEAAQAEAALVEARSDCERAAALGAAIRQRLADTERRDRRAAVDVIVAAAHATERRFLDFARNEYPALARKIAAGLLLEAEVHRLQQTLVTAYGALPRGEIDGLPSLNPPRLLSAAGRGTAVQAHGLGAFVSLPAADGDELAGHWPCAAR